MAQGKRDWQWGWKEMQTEENDSVLGKEKKKKWWKEALKDGSANSYCMIIE